jgi:8-oxo-dGTP pyrophosphatase MutT (NUDIX family)
METEAIRRAYVQHQHQLPGNRGHDFMNVPGRVIPRTDELEHLNPRWASVMMIAVPIDGETRLVLMKRPQYPGVHSGQVSFPGGEREAFDGDDLATALRETEEEIGFHRQALQVLGPTSPLYIPPSNFLVKPFLAVADALPSLTLDPTEVAKVLFPPLRVFLDAEAPQWTELTVMGQPRKVPGFVWENEFIWGATAMMIAELRALLRTP